jgi:hypothetical protein
MRNYDHDQRYKSDDDSDVDDDNVMLIIIKMAIMIEVVINTYINCGALIRQISLFFFSYR